MMSEEHQINLYARYEQRLLSGAISKSQVIPAVVITGFLGSGKTTLVHHVLRNRGSLRIAVLINEVGTLDVDSQLVNAKQGNAALGLPAVDLSGGCVCCSRSEDLAAALRRLRAQPAAGGGGAAAGGAASPSSSSAPCDYLLVETSGAADAGPLAEALVGSGFRLDAVVAVVDAEAGREALKHPVAHAQISCADVVVINKCDLLSPGLAGGGSGLGALADLEDLLEEMAPGVRLVRARYGEVPLTAVLDVEPVGASEGRGGQTAAVAGSGGGGFMSHEAVPSVAGGYRLASAGPLTADGLAVGSSRHTKRRAPQASPAPAPAPATGPATASTTATASHSHHHQHHPPGSQGRDAHAQVQTTGGSEGQDAGGAGPAAASQGHAHAHDQTHTHTHAHTHAALHSGFHTEAVTAEQGPVSLVAFARFVVRRLVREPALLRSKGVLWFGERRGQRFTFHLSGRRRVELSQEGPWEGPPSSCLVLIGTDAAAVRRLRDAFLTEVVRQPPTVRRGGDAAVEGASSGVSAAAAAAATAAGIIATHERMELLGCEEWEGLASTAADPEAVDGGGRSGSDAGGCGGCCHGRGDDAGEGQVLLLQFSTRGSALHGINGEEVNGELLRRVNAGGRMLLAGVTAPGKVSAVTNVQARDRVLSLLLPCAVSEAQAQAAALMEAAEPLLRKAYAHAHNCKCDVASAMLASTR